MRKTYLTNSAEETKRLAEKLASVLAKTGGAMALYGDLGSGKTTFVKGSAKSLGIKKRIVSPTFIFIRSYKIPPPRSPCGPPRRCFYKARVKGTPRMVARRQWRDSSEVEELASVRFLYHIDLYRIEKLKDIRGLGLEEILNDPQNIVAIEWAEKIKKILPKKRIDIFFKYLEENKREIVLTNK